MLSHMKLCKESLLNIQKFNKKWIPDGTEKEKE